MTPFDLAQRFVGEIRELPLSDQHPFIQWGHMLCGFGPNEPDEVPWCSSFVNSICWMLRLPRSKSAAARSWLTVGVGQTLLDARPGYDVVVIARGNNPTQGHVGFFAGWDARPGASISQGDVLMLGGNQSHTVSITPFDRSRILGIRRLSPSGPLNIPV